MDWLSTSWGGGDKANSSLLRLAQYYNCLSVHERTTLEGELVRKCLSRNNTQCSFIEHRNYKVIYRRYASLYFIVAVDPEEEVR